MNARDIRPCELDIGSLRVGYRSANIRQTTDWRIESDEDTVIVHLTGRMDLLETEIDGRGSSRGPAVVGEVWTVPAGTRYRSFARGQTIGFAVYRFGATGPAGTEQRRLALRAGHPDYTLLQHTMELYRSVGDSSDAAELCREDLADRIRQRIRERHSGEKGDLSGPPVRRFSPAECAAIRDYVHERLSGPIALRDLAELVGVTPHQLLVAFREAFGTTPAQHLIAQRVRKAQRQLLHSSHDITTIALQCGFSSHSHLTSTFSQRLAMSPSVFRARYK